ncbi:Uncharacterized protein APZ42_019342 [Daphnia magna]|uniref:Uncharacterized protein n=1 Tax=Daphnia magna TaxID=35525 RepID=A0A162CP42_9CRUS|nr:Uncharacterized protein APZ42_019342 [Daphnia magna]
MCKQITIPPPPSPLCLLSLPGNEFLPCSVFSTSMRNNRYIKSHNFVREDRLQSIYLL